MEKYKEYLEGKYTMIPIELICHELKRLTDDYYKCEDAELKVEIHRDIKLLSKALFLSDLPYEYH